MEKEQSNELIFSDLRVLDLAGEMGVYCGKLLADLGAEVIKIEPPGGDPIRRIGPFVDDDPHPEKSLYWFQFNTNKKSITLDIATADGKSIFNKLAAKSDIIIETFTPGYMDSLGLGYEVLSRENAGLIMTSITPFGQTGPYRHFKGSDIVGLAMGGQMYITGFPEQPPMQTGASQGYYQASLHAAVATLIALHFRDISGLGQYIDTSMQQAVTLSMETAMQFWDLNKYIRPRAGGQHIASGWGFYPCKDSHIALGAAKVGWADLIAWMDSEGYVVESPEVRAGNVLYLKEHVDEVDAIIMPWLLDHSIDELYPACQERRIIGMPVSTPKALVENAHLNERGFFVEVPHPELNASYKYPGPPYRHGRIKWHIANRAPLIGEHNPEILGELGFSKEEMVALKGAGVI